MEKTKDYRYVRFTADVIQDALALWINMVSGKDVQTWNRFTETDNEKWTFDSDEEFFAAYRRPSTNALLNKGISGGAGFAFSFQNWWSRVAVKLDDRSKIERIFDIFEKNVDVSRIPVASEAALAPPTIFIGHGRSGQWRELKDHLTDKHNYRVNAYEVGARAGHVIRDILQDLLIESSFALLVLTAEDETSTGEMRARQNVVHELGLFQGKLGFPRAIAVVEEGVELMSNLDGIQQLCFSSGNISEVYGDVIATIRREFGDLR